VKTAKHFCCGRIRRITDVLLVLAGSAKRDF